MEVCAGRGVKMNDISNTNEIELYLHCTKCLKEKPNHISPSEYISIEVGWTIQGIQVWCKRHNCNIVHINFEGQKYPANATSP